MYYKQLIVGLACFMGLERAGVAQQQQPTTTKKEAPGTINLITNNPPLTRQDTAYAVQELFAARRTGGTVLTIGGGIFTGLFVSSLATIDKVGTGDALAGGGCIVGLGLLPASIGISKLARFSRAREQQVISAYATGEKLPRQYARRLRGNFRPVPASQWTGIDIAEINKPLLIDSADDAMPSLAVSAPDAARADTLDALVGLFNAKRGAGQWPAVLLASGGLVAISASGSERFDYQTGQFEKTPPTTGAVVTGLAMSVGGLVYMLVHNAPYSMAKLDAIGTAYEAGGALPAEIRRKLLPKHFTKGRAIRNQMMRKANRKKR